MSENIPLSGIVLFPETGSMKDLNPSLARQFGMAVNSYVSDGDVHRGTAHVVGYDPQLAVDLLDLYYTDGSGQDLSVRQPNVRDKSKEREILDNFNQLIATELSEKGVSAAGLGDVLCNRRLDIIVPKEINRPRTSTLENRLTYIPAESRCRTVPKVWRPTDTGILTAASDLSVGYHHPLSKRHVEDVSSYAVGHSVHTAAATLQPQVREKVTYEGPLSDEELSRIAPGYQQTVYRKKTALHVANFVIPAPEQSDLVDELASLDLQEKIIRQQYEDAVALPNSDVDPVWVDDSTQCAHAPYLDRTEINRETLARLLDPIDNPEWRSRLR
jgi:hypothetical protein